MCEVHVPVSPTPGFFARVRLVAASLRRFGGPLADSPIVVTVGRDLTPWDLERHLPWSRQLGVEWRWMDAKAHQRFGLFGTALQRFRYDFQSSYVLMLDADTVCVGSLEGLLDVAVGSLGGAVAHMSPTRDGMHYRDGRQRSNPEFWSDLYRYAGLEPRPAELEHTGFGLTDAEPDRRWCPPYFNLGVLAAPSTMMADLGRVIFSELESVDRYVETFFRAQLALTLAIARTGLPWVELPVRFNFPNDPDFWDRYPSEAATVRILHYLRGSEEFDREGDLATGEGLAAFLARPELSPVNALLQARIGELARDGALGHG